MLQNKVKKSIIKNDFLIQVSDNVYFQNEIAKSYYIFIINWNIANSLYIAFKV